MWTSGTRKPRNLTISNASVGLEVGSCPAPPLQLTFGRTAVGVGVAVKRPKSIDKINIEIRLDVTQKYRNRRLTYSSRRAPGSKPT